MEKQEVPIWEKANLTIDEAAAYFGIGTNKLREITSNPDCEFVIRVGAKRMEAGMQRMLYPGFATGKLQKTY